MHYKLDEKVLAQQLLSVETFKKHRDACISLDRNSCEFVWVEVDAGRRLHKIDPTSASLVSDMGAENDSLKQVCEKQNRARQTALENHHICDADLQMAIARNKALRVGRVPDVVIGILNALHDKKLLRFCRVIGTHAMYAYEVAAGVSFEPDSMATNDVDLLLDVNQRIQLWGKFEQLDESMIDILRSVDQTFQRDEEQKESAVNDSGFFVDFMHNMEGLTSGEWPEPYPVSKREGDVYPVPAPRAERFLKNKPLEQVVIGLNGSMALMPTIEPQVFVEFKRWMSNSPTRDSLKRKRDSDQADAIENLLRNGLLK